MGIKNAISKFGSYLKKNNWLIILFILFIAHIFFRFYLLQERLNFNWDQVDNAWAAKRIIVDHKFPLLGMVAKANSGIYIGPLYYYLIAIIYWIFGLNPIASGVMAGLTSIFTFFVIFYIVKKLFSNKVALIAVGILTFSYFIIAGDRSQWPVNLIAPVSALVFYFLYKVLTGEVKYLLFLAGTIGFSLHVHFTSIFYPIIVLLSLPFLRWSKQTIKYILISIPVFLVFLIPNYIAGIGSEISQTDNLTFYLNVYYHGLHLTRVLQLTHDAFIEFQLIMRGWFQDMNYLAVLAFYIVYFFTKPTRRKFIMSYLIGLWFIVPWLVFATYKGEITNYYFFTTRPLVLMILAYLTYWIFSIRNYLPKVAIVIFWLYFSYVNTVKFFAPDHGNFNESVKKTKVIIERGQKVDSYPYIPESYLYYYYTEVNKIKK
jgi:4-amino-4-deoxy-L-arabinose transferase-like glycosyltransferase